MQVQSVAFFVCFFVSFLVICLVLFFAVILYFLKLGTVGKDYAALLSTMPQVWLLCLVKWSIFIR